MNEYEDRKQARIDRYREKAEKARQESNDLSRQASKMAEAIPPGQPMMPDHYSYKSDQRYRQRMWDKMDQSVAAAKKAEYYENRAEAAENNTAISSDDPDAIVKLTQKLETLQLCQTRMKQMNAYYRKHGTCQGFEGLSEADASSLDERIKNGYSWETVPYPAYTLSNNNQEIRRIKDRIKALTLARELGYQGWEFDGGRVEANTGNNRLQVFFDEVPGEQLRGELKSRGFHWSRKEQAWQRQLTDHAIRAASRIAAIRPIDGSDPVKIQLRKTVQTGHQR